MREIEGERGERERERVRASARFVRCSVLIELFHQEFEEDRPDSPLQLTGRTNGGALRVRTTENERFLAVPTPSHHAAPIMLITIVS